MALSSVSLAWLMIAYGWNSSQTIHLWTGGAYFILFGRLVGALVSSNSYVADVLWVSTFRFHLATWACTALAVIASLFLATRRRPPANSRDWQRRTAWCCKVAVCYMAVSFTILDLVGSTAKTVWTTPSPFMTYLYGALVLAPALLMMPFTILAIPNDSMDESAPSPEIHGVDTSEAAPEGRDRASV
ncbi:hypothetical protein [Actinomadura sp. 9N407]|uniref:hypothetical protein n=1 Tax=Actinomadura sp. 9N407 TaxID=3375154 RepID=UPI0037C176B3